MCVKCEIYYYCDILYESLLNNKWGNFKQRIISGVAIKSAARTVIYYAALCYMIWCGSRRKIALWENIFGTF